MIVPVQVLSSRSYSFNGRDNRTVNIVEAVCLLATGEQQVVGKINTRGDTPLKPGPYNARLRASEKDGKLAFTLGDFTPRSAS